MSYFLAPPLVQLRAEVNAAWPHRDRTSDGWIGDTSHAARPSDHNPDRSDGGIVRAVDIDEDLVAGLTAAGEAMPLVETIIADVRTRYVIYEGRIWTRDSGRWAPYTGANAHRHHIHVSVRTGRGYDRDASPWGIATTTPEDDMTPGESRQLAEIHAALGVGGAPDPSSVLAHVRATVNLLHALPNAVWMAPVIGGSPFDGSVEAHSAADWLTAAGYRVGAILAETGKLPAPLDPAAFAQAVIDAIPTNIAQDVIDGLGARLQTGPRT